MVAVVSAIAAFIWLVLLAQMAAFVINPHGRADLNHTLAQARVSAGARPGLMVLYEVILILSVLVPAVLHAFAFYGLLSLRKAGWVVAFLLAILWSVVLVGLPFAYLLWKRDNRQAYGIP